MRFARSRSHRRWRSDPEAIPGAAGLGGGSADAAAVLRVVIRITRKALDLDALRRVGAGVVADEPSQLAPGHVLGGSGRGGRADRPSGDVARTRPEPRRVGNRRGLRGGRPARYRTPTTRPGGGSSARRIVAAGAGRGTRQRPPSGGAVASSGARRLAREPANRRRARRPGHRLGPNGVRRLPRC